MSSTLSLSKILADNKDCLSLSPANKIVCKYSNHEMPPNAVIVNQYLQSKKFIKAKEWYSIDYSKYLPYIVPHKSDNRKLYCTLTKYILNKIPEDVKKHIDGKKFKRLKAAAEKKRAEKEEAAKLKGDDSDEEMWIPPDEILNEGNDEEKIQMAISEPMDEEEDDEDEDDEDEDLADEGAAKSLKKGLPLAPHKQNKKAFKVKSGKRSLDSATKLHSKKLKK